jgi:hypothetical protein
VGDRLNFSFLTGKGPKEPGYNIHSSGGLPFTTRPKRKKNATMTYTFTKKTLKHNEET